MEKEKLKKTVTKILFIAVIILAIWFIFIYPLIKFNGNEDKLVRAAQRYLEINKNMAPREGEVRTIPVQTLLDKKYVEDLRTAYNNKTCKVKNSFVKVKRKSGIYNYYVYLECGIFKSNIDHDGPVITLNGNKTIYIDKDSSFTDPGVKSVIDNTDGKMDVKSVDVKGYISTSVTGTYEVTYTAVDSFENKSVVKRKVIVTQNLTKTVEKATDNDNIYKGRYVNNYIRFSNQLFRIVGLDKDGNIKIVSNEDISHVDYNSIDEWLEDYYLNHINEKSKELLVESAFCSDSVTKEKVDSITTCKNAKNAKNAGLLSINEYNNSSKEGESYLYTNTINWTASNLNKNEAWTTRYSFAGTDSKYMSYDRNYNFNVRPVLIIKKNTKVTDGDGSYNHPYELGDTHKVKAGSSTTKMLSGEYVSYKGSIYRVVEPDDNGNTKVISDFNITDSSIEKFVLANIYNPNAKNTIAYYIENYTSKNINAKIFAKHKVEVPIYKTTATYSGKKSSTKTYNIKFAAPSMYEMYSATYGYTWYIESSEDESVRYLSSSNGTVFYNMETLLYPNFDTKFVGYLRKDAVVVSGSGTKMDPYQISY